MKYKKKPVIVEAIKFDGELSAREIQKKYGERVNYSIIGDKRLLMIHTLEGEMRADIGDYIIEGVRGEIYPCKPDVFEKTYEKVDQYAAPQIVGRED